MEELLSGCGCCRSRLAKFMGTEESIIYSYDLATVPSVLPAFANAKDVIVCDEVQPCSPLTSQILRSCAERWVSSPKSCAFTKVVRKNRLGSPMVCCLDAERELPNPERLRPVESSHQEVPAQ